MALSVNNAGTWTTVAAEKLHVNNAGTWTGPKRVYTNDAGTWKLIWQNDKPTNLTLTDLSTCPSPPDPAWNIEVSWSCAADLGVVIYRDGAQIGSVGAGTYAYNDTATLSVTTTYEYSIRTTYASALSAAVSESITTGSPCGV